MRPSLAETWILAALIFASASLFWVRFSRVVRVIRAAKPEPTWSLRPAAPRVGRFIWEVLLQGKVIFDRPAAGLAHAFVFWGFCAFALVTVNHIAAGFGVTLMPRDAIVGQVYFGFVAVFAVVVAVSITGLAVRRFILRPVWLGKVSPESGVIALLILLLMITYLAGFRFAEETAASRINWWVHTLTLLLFLPLIPHTKHLHLVLSPLTILRISDSIPARMSRS